MAKAKFKTRWLLASPPNAGVTAMRVHMCRTFLLALSIIAVSQSAFGAGAEFDFDVGVGGYTGSVQPIDDPVLLRYGEVPSADPELGL
jgi:hypothetical protein